MSRTGSFTYEIEAPCDAAAAVRNETRVTETANGVDIAVTITMTAPTLLFGYAFRTARAAHLELGERIARRLSTATL